MRSLASPVEEQLDNETLFLLAEDGFDRLYACEPTPFVEAVAESLVRLGHDPRAIRTERFGPTGR